MEVETGENEGVNQDESGYLVKKFTRGARGEKERGMQI
jgi:hypothetical protein